VSDSHAVRSQAVLPTRPEVVKTPDPKPDPYNVTLADPEDPEFTLFHMLSPARSSDTAWLTLPTPFATLMTAPRVPKIQDPVRHRTDVSDAHVDRSQLL
jgi:hypothetical protein